MRYFILTLLLILSGCLFDNNKPKREGYVTTYPTVKKKNVVYQTPYAIIKEGNKITRGKTTFEAVR
jgi:hypothetical protein